MRVVPEKSPSPGIVRIPICPCAFLHIVFAILPAGETQVFECRTWATGPTAAKALADWKRLHPRLAVGFIRAYGNPPAQPDPYYSPIPRTIKGRGGWRLDST